MRASAGEISPVETVVNHYSLRMPDDDSAVLALSYQDVRVTNMGLRMLEDDEAVPSTEHLLLQKRLNAADSVLSERNWLRGAERALTDPKAPAPVSSPNENDTVLARLTLTQMRLAAEAAETFLNRPDPITDPFHKPASGGIPRLVDPPEAVRPTVKRFQQAVAYWERSSALAETEKNLLS